MRTLLLATVITSLLHGSNLPAAETGELDHQLLFDSGQEYPRYRIPSLIVCPSGTVLAICEGRADGGGLVGNIDIVLRRSNDHGRAWSKLEVVADGDNNTLGNPCVLLDESNQRLWLAFTRSLGSDTEAEIIAGKSQERTRVLVTSSDDEGRTWTKPRDITSTAKDPSWTWYGTGPGRGIQMQHKHPGRLVFPSYHAEEGTQIYRSHMVYSDDHGRTWKHGAAVGEQCGECHVVETADGDLVLNARTNHRKEKERRTTARSRDGGATWGPVSFDENLYDPHCEACVIALPKDKEHPARWLFTHPAGPDRHDLTARLSLDEGRTWPVSRLVRAGNSQYSCLAQLADGQIGCLYDCWIDGNYRLFFVRFSEAWLRAK